MYIKLRKVFVHTLLNHPVFTLKIILVSKKLEYFITKQVKLANDADHVNYANLYILKESQLWCI